MAARFGPTAQLLHWSMAVLVLGELALGQWMSEAGSRETRRALLALHESVGMLIGLLLVTRLGWRLGAGLPDWPAEVGPGARRALHGLEAILYVAMAAMPATGLALTMAAGWDVQFFGSLPVPSLIEPSDLWQERLESLHRLGAALFGVAILLHAGLVVVLDRRTSPGFLRRMLPGARRERDPAA
jgi:cytochrome b561